MQLCIRRWCHQNGHAALWVYSSCSGMAQWLRTCTVPPEDGIWFLAPTLVGSQQPIRQLFGIQCLLGSKDTRTHMMHIRSCDHALKINKLKTRQNKSNSYQGLLVPKAGEILETDRLACFLIFSSLENRLISMPPCLKTVQGGVH